MDIENTDGVEEHLLYAIVDDANHSYNTAEIFEDYDEARNFYKSRRENASEGRWRVRFYAFPAMLEIKDGGIDEPVDEDDLLKQFSVAETNAPGDTAPEDDGRGDQFHKPVAEDSNDDDG